MLQLDRLCAELELAAAPRGEEDLAHWHLGGQTQRIRCAALMEVDGEDLVPLSPLKRVRRGLRRSFQTEQVVEDLTVWDNVRAMLDHVPAGPRDAADDVAEVLQFAHLAGVATRLGREIDLFHRRMVELAKALVGRPRLLLLDEPGAGLDERESSLPREALLKVHDFRGAQVLLIDHDVDLIAATC